MLPPIVAHTLPRRRYEPLVLDAERRHVHYRIEMERRVTWRWALALSD